ncbi:hypothetical protein CFN78_06685 [Amycolatopsis antarctica]|uniref:Uncharacterized protein n=1 Tax=Amycolatopsis antarctica TaxID=1854586 RepID=A0A263D7H3_9PSEU|nr:hypothetical protein [Amycolatopsis antarctica]OZM73968.1 hypothetical protein CFN78_06685 [Amycolatopsis antarctica]
MQSAEDTTLAAALASTDIQIEPLLEFDWARNGLYNHKYSDLSWLVTDVTDEAATIKGDLPDDVTRTLQGFSSAELRATLGGARYGDDDADTAWNARLAADGIAADQLFSPYLATSPLYGYTVTGVAVRYSRVTSTALGEVVTRQFTGWLRSFEINAAERSVSIVASDVLHLTNKKVTLPLWGAYATDAAFDYWDKTNPESMGRSYSRPISLTWAVEETLRRAGAPTGPVARDDALYYVSCNGSMIPSVGDISDKDVGRIWSHGVSWRNNAPWEAGLYGLAPKAVDPYLDWGTRDWANYTVGRAARTLYVPNNGGTGDVTVGMSTWAKTDPAGGQVRFAKLHLGLERNDGNESAAVGVNYQPAGISMVVYDAGYVWLRIKGSTWSWWRGTAPSKGWHFYDCRIRLTGSAITCELRIDDVLVSLPEWTPSPSTGWTTAGFEPVTNLKRNPTAATANFPVQHMQIYAGNTATVGAYNPDAKHPPKTADGRPLAVVHGSSLAELTFLPDSSEVEPWELLGKLAGADFAVVHTDEYGTVHYVPHYNMRNDWKIAQASAPTIDDDRLLGYLVNPTFDGKRNRITIPYTERRAEEAIVWECDNPSLFHAKENYTTIRDVAIQDVISVRGGRLPHNTDPDGAAVDDVYAGCAGNVYGENWSVITPDGVSDTDVWPGENQRTLKLYQLVYNAPDPWRSVRPSFAGGKQGAIFVPGSRYTKVNPLKTTVSRTSDIATYGVQELILDEHPWRQTRDTAVAIGTSVLNDTIVPSPLIDGIEIHADPRMQLRDVVKLTSQEGITGAIFAQIIGITRLDSPSGGSIDRLAMRVLRTPGQWILGDPDLSVLGTTTILGS